MDAQTASAPAIGLARVREVARGAQTKIAEWADKQVARNASHARALVRYLESADGGDWPEDH